MSAGARSLPEVIDKMLEQVPEGEQSLRIKLKSVRDSSLYAPPESQVVWWERGVEVLEECLGRLPLDGWRERVRLIWMKRGDSQ